MLTWNFYCVISILLLSLMTGSDLRGTALVFWEKLFFPKLLYISKMVFIRFQDISPFFADVAIFCTLLDDNY